MFVFKPTTQTYSDPVSATFLPGIPFGREKSRGDICLLHEGFAASKIFLNSLVLREAILNSKDFLEEVLDIKITDKSAKEEKVDLKAKQEKKEKNKKAAKEADLYIAEDLPIKPEESETQKPESETENKPVEEPTTDEVAEPKADEATEETPAESSEEDKAEAKE